MCFFLELYGTYVFNLKLNRDDARQHCIVLGGSLLEVRTQEEINRATQLRVQGVSPLSWIGAQYDLQRDEWIWISNSEAIDLNIFSWIESLDPSEHCAFLSSFGYPVSLNCNSTADVACDFGYN